MKRRIFVESENKSEVAYIGWEEGKIMALQGIKMGYKSSADKLVDEALKMGKKARIDILDTYIFPIIFLYRHSIEVSLKQIYYRATNEMERGGHDLLSLWDNLNRDVLGKLGEWDKEEKNDIRELLKELQSEYKDEKSDVWRYLFDKNGKPYITQWRFIDYKNLRETISWLYDELDKLYDYIDYLLSN